MYVYLYLQSNQYKFCSHFRAPVLWALYLCMPVYTCVMLVCLHAPVYACIYLHTRTCLRIHVTIMGENSLYEELLATRKCKVCIIEIEPEGGSRNLRNPAAPGCTHKHVYAGIRRYTQEYTRIHRYYFFVYYAGVYTYTVYAGIHRYCRYICMYCSFLLLGAYAFRKWAPKF